MLALSLVMIVVSASPSGYERPYRESRTERAARLMSPEEFARLTEINAQLAELQRTSGNTALLVTSIVVMSAALIVPICIAAVALVATFFVGFIGIFAAAGGSLAVLGAIPSIWVTLFSWIPAEIWVVIAAVTVVGGGLLIAALAGDGPRREQVGALKAERKRMISLASTRPEQSMLQMPLTTLATF